MRCALALFVIILLHHCVAPTLIVCLGGGRSAYSLVAAVLSFPLNCSVWVASRGGTGRLLPLWPSIPSSGSIIAACLHLFLLQLNYTLGPVFMLPN